MYARVFTAANKVTNLPDRGFSILLGGRCPRCGKGVARLVSHLPFPDPNWDPGDVPITPVPCCRPVWPTEVVLMGDGRPTAVEPFSKLLASDPVSYSGDYNWALIVLDRAKPVPVRYPSLATFSRAGEWALEAEGILRASRYWPQEALQFAHREGQKIAAKGLWADLWEFAVLSCRAARESPAAAPAVMTLYRALYRFASGKDRILAGLDGGKPVLVHVTSQAYPPEEIPNPLGFVWPWDLAAFTFGVWGYGEVEQVAFGAVYGFALSGGESPLGHWARAREERKYTLTPLGVRAVLGKGEVREVFLREVGPTTVYYELGVPGLPKGAVRGWFDWEEEVGFSPWQLIHGFRPGEDPVLGLASGLFAELVTAEARRIAHKVSGTRSMVLPPGEGKVKVGPRVVYMGDPQTRGVRSTRVPLPPEARRSPRPHSVAGHLRRISGQPSEEAKKAAEEYRVVLPEGFTFVRPHLRGRRDQS